MTSLGSGDGLMPTTCETCGDSGIVGTPPDGYMPCPDCSVEDHTDDRLDDRGQS